MVFILSRPVAPILDLKLSMILLISSDVFSPVLDFYRRLLIFFIISWRLAVNPDIYLS